MDAWVWWLVVALLLGVAEVSTTTLFFAMLTGGAFAAGAASLAGADVPVQLIVFAAVSALLILVVRPVARRHLRTPALIRSGVAALVGSEAVVLEQVDPRDGRIKLAGEIWSARSYDGESELSAGTAVYVIAIEGATALVAER
jgi:membrane protein implicated in regulation of membrane protease activity